MVRKTAVKTLTPAAIDAEVRSYPPLKRDSIRKIYVGKEVDWRVTFFTGWKESKGRVGLAFRDKPLGMTIFGHVPLTDYPWLESLNVDEAVWIRGQIRKVDSMTIDLEILELSVPELAAV